MKEHWIGWNHVQSQLLYKSSRIKPNTSTPQLNETSHANSKPSAPHRLRPASLRGGRTYDVGCQVYKPSGSPAGTFHIQNGPITHQNVIG